MLKHIYINNYAIINELKIDFNKGMNAITGETGAGKSIIVGALSLILGERADISSLVNKEKKCVIEGVFIAGEKQPIQDFLLQNDLDVQPEIVVRREITTNGKSRAFINDTPVTLSQLKIMSEKLVDLHQQFDTLTLGDNNFQVTVLDALAGNNKLIADYIQTYRRWQNTIKELDALKQQQQQFDKESDYNQFQFDELAEADFKENELEEIDADIKMLSHAEGIKTALDRAYSELAEGEQPIVPQLKSIVNLLNGLSNYHKNLPQLVERLQSAQIELQDISADLESLNHEINYDAQKIEALNERLSIGYKLQKKHGVHSTNELLKIQEELQQKLQTVLHIGDHIASLENEEKTLQQKVIAIAEKISAARKKQVSPFQTKINQLLSQVGMPNASLQVAITPQKPAPGGIDDIQFLFDANKSGQYKPVSKVASGGELSRLMLCIKSLVAEKMDMPTLIFDEIDSGISGEAARQVGIIMKELAANRQVVCITHQPQIAGKAHAHFFVYKQLDGTSVNTNIRQLQTEERITTIAQMLSGQKPTAAALQNAREMVEG